MIHSKPSCTVYTLSKQWDILYMTNSTVHTLKHLDILYMIHMESMCTVYILSELTCTVYTLSQTAIRILSITSFKLKQETRTL